MAKNKPPSDANDKPRTPADAASTAAPGAPTAIDSAAQALVQTGGETHSITTAESQGQGAGTQQAGQVAAAAVAAPAPAPGPQGATGGETHPDATAEGQGAGPQQADQVAAWAERWAASVAGSAPMPVLQDTSDYLVGSVPIRHNGCFYGVGDDIALTHDQARRLGGLVAPAPETKE